MLLGFSKSVILTESIDDRVEVCKLLITRDMKSVMLIKGYGEGKKGRKYTRFEGYLYSRRITNGTLVPPPPLPGFHLSRASSSMVLICEICCDTRLPACSSCFYAWLIALFQRVL